MKKQVKGRAPQNQLRIIGGEWRGRKLPFPDIEGLRPTTDRIRETLFNWLQPELHAAHCLDLFAGSGALGFECLSRGAQSVTLLDSNQQAAAQLEANRQQLKATEHCTVLQVDALSWLATSQPSQMDIAFVDPPYQLELLAPSLQALEESNCLADQALIYFEHDRKQPAPALPDNWSIHRTKAAGAVVFNLARRNSL